LKATENGVIRGSSSSSSRPTTLSSTSSSTLSSSKTSSSTPIASKTSSPTSAPATTSEGASTKPAAAPVAIGKVDSRTVIYYENLVKKYDKNKDGALSKDEWASMSKSPEKDDADGDGLVTALEMAAAVSK
jgi:hypothetical protein